jgi:hypothetical protein
VDPRDQKLCQAILLHSTWHTCLKQGLLNVTSDDTSERSDVFSPSVNRRPLEKCSLERECSWLPQPQFELSKFLVSAAHKINGWLVGIKIKVWYTIGLFPWELGFVFFFLFLLFLFFVLYLGPHQAVAGAWHFCQIDRTKHIFWTHCPEMASQNAKCPYSLQNRKHCLRSPVIVSTWRPTTRLQ